jgi:hypothetical protein
VHTPRAPLGSCRALRHRFGGSATNRFATSQSTLLQAAVDRDTAVMLVQRRWATLAVLSLAGAFGCADDDAGRFGADGVELAEYRQEPCPSLNLSTDTVTLAVNETLQLTATHCNREGVQRDVREQAQWSSDDPMVAWVQDGSIVGVFPGSAQVTVSHAGSSDSVAVEVTTESLEAIEVAPSLIELPNGMTATLRALGVFRQGARRDISGLVQWTSSDSEVAAIDGTVVRARELGTATLEASLDDVTGSASIAVTGARLLDLEIVRQRESMPIGTSQQLRARGSFSDEQTIDITDLVQWGSEDGNLASIHDNGLVSARGVGEVNLWARYLGHAAQTVVAITADP